MGGLGCGRSATGGAWMREIPNEAHAWVSVKEPAQVQVHGSRDVPDSEGRGVPVHASRHLHAAGLRGGLRRDVGGESGCSTCLLF